MYKVKFQFVYVTSSKQANVNPESRIYAFNQIPNFAKQNVTATIFCPAIPSLRTV